MKSIAKLLCFLALLWAPACYAIDSRSLIDAVENQDASRIIEYFDSPCTIQF